MEDLNGEFALANAETALDLRKVEMDEERLLDLGGDFTLANAETALELHKCNVMQQHQRIEEREAAFAARVESFEEVSRNLGSTTNIEVISMLKVSLKLGEAWRRTVCYSRRACM